VRVHLHGARASHHGIAEVRVDSSPAVDVDLYAAQRGEDVRLWSSEELAPGEHVLTVRVTGRQNTAASGATVAVDRVVVERLVCADGGSGGSAGTSGRGGSAGTGGTGGTGGRGGTSGTGGTGGSSGTGGTGGSAGTGGSGGSTGRTTMYVSGRDLFTPCGEKVVLRGVNHPTLYVDRAGNAIPEIAKTGANVVRLFWYAKHGISITEADGVIGRTVAAGMIPMLEMHDATGPSNWGNMADIVSYWTSSSALALIQKYRSRLLVNIANEAGPNGGQDYAGFENTYKNAITSLRNAGIEVPLVIDASGWGRDYEVLFQRGPALITHDPRHNLILSAHLYDVMTRTQIANVYQRAVTANLPFIVGEFAHRAPAGGCGPALDYLALIGEAQPRGIGWLAWSWGDNDAATWWNGDCSEFDMTRTFSYDTLERWGREVAVTDANSIRNTSVRPASLTTGSCP
jgi:mannan endo-1,4-beta-mannosidase